MHSEGVLDYFWYHVGIRLLIEHWTLDLHHKLLLPYPCIFVSFNLLCSLMRHVLHPLFWPHVSRDATCGDGGATIIPYMQAHTCGNLAFKCHVSSDPCRDFDHPYAPKAYQRPQRHRCCLEKNTDRVLVTLAPDPDIIEPKQWTTTCHHLRLARLDLQDFGHLAATLFCLSTHR